jgi:hypothetical protein
MTCDGQAARPDGRKRRRGSVLASDVEGVATERTMSEQKLQVVERTLRLCGHDDEASRQVLCRLWDEAFEAGRLAALDELQDRFCVCMK